MIKPLTNSIKSCMILTCTVYLCLVCLNGVKMVRKSLKDGRKSIYLFALVFVTYSLIYMTKNCYSAAMASIVKEGIMTKSETGLIAAVFYLVYAPFQIVGGIAADRHSPHKLILFGTLGAGLCNLLVYIFSGNYIAMLIIWSLNAIIQFGIWPSVFKIVTSQLKESQRTRAVFYISFSSTLGLLLSYICAALITDWRFNFLLSAIVLFASVVFFFFAYRSLNRDMTVDTIEVETEKQQKDKKRKEKGRFWLIVKAGIPILLVVYTVQCVLNLGIKSLAPVMLMENYSSLTPSLANALNIILVLAGSAGLLFSRIPFFRRFSEPTSIAIMFGIALPLLLILTFIGDVSLVFLIVSLVVLMISVSSTTVFFSYISKTFEKFGFSATVAGLFNCMASVSLMLSNYVFAKLADTLGWGFTTKSWLVIGIVSFALAGIAIPIWKRFKKKMSI